MNNNQQILSSSQAMMYSGPLPTSNEFAGYDKTLPGAAERLLSLAEKEVDHRHEADNKVIKITSRGQIFGFLAVILAIGAVFVSMFLNQPLAAIAPTIVAITGLAAVFVGKNNTNGK